MKPYILALSLASSLVFVVGFQQNPAKSSTAPRLVTGEIEGRWDLTLTANGETWPSWIEVTKAGTPSVRIVERTGSVHPAKDVKLENSHVTFNDGNGHIKYD